MCIHAQNWLLVQLVIQFNKTYSPPPFFAFLTIHMTKPFEISSNGLEKSTLSIISVQQMSGKWQHEHSLISHLLLPC